MKTNEKLFLLRREMKKNKVDAFLIPTADPHMSEYLPEHWKTRQFFSGFDGSAGTLVVTTTKSALWADGRYHIQAQNQLAGSEIQLMKDGISGVATVQDWLAQELAPGGVLGIDGAVTSLALVEKMEKAFSGKNIQIKEFAPTAKIWVDRPPVPANPIWLLEDQYAGQSVREKLAEVRKGMEAKEADGALFSGLDSLVWLFNIRGGDVAYSPFVLAFAFVEQSRALLFINQSCLPEVAKKALEAQGVTLCHYDEIRTVLANDMQASRVLVDPASISYSLYHCLADRKNITVESGQDLVQGLKCIKNPVEQKNTINAHIKDGLALVRFQMELEQSLAEGKSFTEWDAEAMLFAQRQKLDLFLEESFTTIAAYGANGAMMHYHGTKERAAKIEPKGFLLVDSGGQYKDGTTDTTRTYAVGPLTRNEKEKYTLVLRAHLRLANTVFLDGCTGGNVDIMARSLFWEKGFDYRCGTGHGVGFVGGVHEGPQSLRCANTIKLQEGMNLTIEPGYYESGVMGIRIENEYFVQQKETTEYGTFLHFANFTYCPIDTTPLVTESMEKWEIAYLNRYQQTVLETLSPHLTQTEKQWLTEKCAPIV